MRNYTLLALLYCSLHTLFSMSHNVLINVTKALMIMLDPALRCAPYLGKDRKCDHAKQWRTYQQSSIETKSLVQEDPSSPWLLVSRSYQRSAVCYS